MAMLRKQEPRLWEKSGYTRVFRSWSARAEKVPGGAALVWGSGPQWVLTRLLEPGIGRTAGCSRRSRDHPRETRGGVPSLGGGWNSVPCGAAASLRPGALSRWPSRERAGRHAVRAFLGGRVGGQGGVGRRYPPEGRCLVLDQTRIARDDSPLRLVQGCWPLLSSGLEAPKAFRMPLCRVTK